MSEDDSDIWSDSYGVAEDMAGNEDENWNLSNEEEDSSDADIVAPKVSLNKQEVIRIHQMRKHLDKLRGNADIWKKQVSKTR